MEGQNGKGLPAKRMSRPMYYPESSLKITSPFFVMSCTCGYREWRIFSDKITCPKCGRDMVSVYPVKGGVGGNDPPRKSRSPDGGGQ